MSMKQNYFIIVITIFSITLVLCTSPRESSGLLQEISNSSLEDVQFVFPSLDKGDSLRDVYEGCGTEEKYCIGDTEGCVEMKNCTFMGSSIINSTHFTLRIYDRCTFDPKRYRVFKEGSYNPDTIDIQRGPAGKQVITCRKITHKDFKFFFFWIGEKCTLSINKGLYSIGYISHEEHLAKCRRKYENKTENAEIVLPSKQNLTHWLWKGVASVSDVFSRAKKCTAEIIGKEYEIIEDVLYITKYSLNANDPYPSADHSKCSSGPHFNMLFSYCVFIVWSLLCVSGNI